MIASIKLIATSTMIRHFKNHPQEHFHSQVHSAQQWLLLIFFVSTTTCGFVTFSVFTSTVLFTGFETVFLTVVFEDSKLTKRQRELYEIIELNLTVRGSVHFESFQDSRRYVAPHWHDAIEIISVTHGNLTVNIEQKEFHLKGGDCIILPPYSIHSTLSTSGNSAM